MPQSETIDVEITDTFGGEANYSWVRRYSATITANTVQERERKVIREAKRLVGWTGLRCKKEDTGDLIKLTTSGLCQVVFITFRWDDLTTKTSAVELAAALGPEFT